MDIEQIMDHIASYEEEIENDLSLSTIQTLTTLYQKAIEYYSAFDDIMFAQILNKMQSMLARDDIEMVLKSKEEGDNANLSQSTADSRQVSTESTSESVPTQQ